MLVILQQSRPWRLGYVGLSLQNAPQKVAGVAAAKRGEGKGGLLSEHRRNHSRVGVHFDGQAGSDRQAGAIRGLPFSLRVRPAHSHTRYK